MLNPYVSSAIASILTGVHLFGIKYSYTNATFGSLKFYIIIFFALFLWSISRIFVYMASVKLPITITHMIMNLSILVSTLCSIIIYQTPVDIPRFLAGILLMLFGVYFIEHSITYHAS